MTDEDGKRLDPVWQEYYNSLFRPKARRRGCLVQAAFVIAFWTIVILVIFWIIHIKQL